MIEAPARPRVGFVGAGRVGNGLSLALTRAGYTVVGIASRTGRPSAQDVVDRADVVFLTVQDDAIAGVTGQLAWRHGVAAVHCSGAAELSVLEHAARAGAAVGGFHPLHMFGDPKLAVRGLASCAIVLEADEPLAGVLAGMVEALGARQLRVPAGGRAAYHAGAHYAGPFVIALLAEAVAIWGRVGIEPDDALAALLPLVRGGVDSIVHSGLARAMAGPVARGDLLTVKEHVEALGRLEPGMRDFYCQMALRTIPLAIASGKLDAARAEEMRALLDG